MNKDALIYNGMVGCAIDSVPDAVILALLDVSKIDSLGWHASIPLRTGTWEVCEEYLQRARSTLEV